jgi:hypothetical protein
LATTNKLSMATIDSNARHQCLIPTLRIPPFAPSTCHLRPADNLFRRPKQVQRCAFLHAATSRESDQHPTTLPHFHFLPRISAAPTSLATARLLIIRSHGKHDVTLSILCCFGTIFFHLTATTSKQHTFTASQHNTHKPCISWPRIYFAAYSHSKPWRGVKRARKSLATNTHRKRQSGIDCDESLPIERPLHKQRLQPLLQ